jgi:predicted lipoprotein with Yx(FWY)xxD motif
MRIRRTVPLPLVFGLLWFAVAGVMTAQGASRVSIPPAAHVAAAPTISLRSTAYGKILVNSKGYTLYLWAKDKKNKSNCSGACLDVWPFVLVHGKPTAGAGVNQKLLGTIKEKGGNDVTYNGWPLYTFASDTKPGVISGEGNTSFGGPWWVVSPTGTAITKKP